MTEIKKISKMRFLLTMITVLCLSVFAVFSYGCNSSSDSSSSSSSSSSSETKATLNDTAVLNNGSFEYYTNDVTLPYSSSVTKWSRSYDYINGSSTDASPSSSNSFKSGVIDTTDGAYGDLIESQNFDDEDYKYLYLTDDATKIDADGFYTEGSVKYSSIKIDDKYYYNPYTPYKYSYTEKVENEDDEDGIITNSKVLMIHNRNTEDKLGTAQYFKSSSTFTVAKGTSGKISVWVNTYGINSLYTTDAGAYIRVDQTVNSQSVAPLYLKNINTDGKWVLYTVYVTAGEFADSTFTLYLGLGQGSKNLTSEYVEGFAFFDDAQYTAFDDDSTETVPATAAVLNVFTATKNKDIHNKDVFNGTATKNDATTEKKYVDYTFAVTHEKALTAFADFTNGANPTRNDDAFVVGKEKNAATAASNYDLPANVSNAENIELGKVVYINYSTGNGSSYTYTSNKITVPANTYAFYSFWIKVDCKYENGLKVNVKDLGKKDDNQSTDHILSTAIVTDTIKTENDDKDNWVKYSFLIDNTTEDGNGNTIDREFVLEAVFGPTAKTTSIDDFPVGYAVLGGFRTLAVNADNKVYIASDDYTAITLKADVSAAADAETTDSYTFNSDFVNNIKTNPGAYVSVGGTRLTAKGDETKAVSGIFNTEYSGNYTEIAAADNTGLQSLEKTGENDYVQALMIKNKVATAFGYAYPKQTLTAGSTAKITVKVRAFDDATAYVYIVNKANNEVLTFDYNGTKVEFAKAITKNEGTDNGWTTVTFYVKAGESDEIKFGVELYNGEKYGDNTTSTGLVVFDALLVTTSASDTVESLAETDRQLMRENTTTSGSYVKAPVDENDEEVTDNTKKYFEVDYKYECADASAKEYITLADFTMTDHKTTYLVEETDDSDSTSDSTSDSEQVETPANSYDKWLYISSLVIAVALIIALIGIIVRMFIKKMRARKIKAVGYYSADSREKTIRKIEKNKQKKEKDYDYDNLENNVVDDDDDVEEEVIEEPETSEENEAADDGEDESDK